MLQYDCKKLQSTYFATYTYFITLSGTCVNARIQPEIITDIYILVIMKI